MPKVIDMVRVTQNPQKLQQHIVRKAYTPGVRNAVRSVQVDLRVWHEAMRLAKGDSTRIVVHSPTEVVVVNQSKKKR